MKSPYVTYKDMTINGILRIRNIKFNREELEKMTIKQLEKIYTFPDRYMKEK